MEGTGFPMDRISMFLCAMMGLVALLCGAHTVAGAGFALYEGSARGNALGGGLVARGNDPSALFYNPAGITRLSGFHVMAGATAIAPSTEIRTVYQAKPTRSRTEQDIWMLPHLYASCQFSDITWLGLGVFSRFGLGTSYDPAWPGRYNTYKAEVHTLTVNPNMAFKLTDHLSVAVGASWVWFDLALKQKIDFPNVFNPNPETHVMDIDQSLSGDSRGLGFNVALHYQVCDQLALGISYQSPVRQKVKGHVDFTKPAAVRAMFPALFNDTTAHGRITLPAMVFLGAALRPADRLTVELGGIWTGWSSYDKLTICYGRPILDPIQPGVTSATRQANWHDVWRVHAGLEYALSERLDLRCGYVWDASPVPDDTADYLVPANDRHLIACGLGVHKGTWTLDLSYGYLHVEGRTVHARPADGILDSRFEGGRAHLIGLSINHSF